MQVVVETPEFLKQAEKCIDDNSKNNFIDYIAKHSSAGEIITGTGGARKIRWSAKNKGKKSGVRIIYYYHNRTLPIFLFTMYGKNMKANLSHAEKNVLKLIIDKIVKTYED